jgi:lipopolysaccharide export system protein LptA
MRPLFINFFRLTAFIFLVIANNSHAENADRQQPINLESDSVTVDDAQKISTFVGQVKLTQGTLKITADKLIVVQDAAGFSTSTATGQLATFRQKREGSEEIVEGYAETIIYDTRNEIVDLKTKARVKRTADEVRGDHINYSTKTEIFKVLGLANADANTPNQGRVRAVIQPKSKDSKQGKP